MKCRIDKSTDLMELFSLGGVYVSDFLQDTEEENIKNRVPLTVCLSKTTGLLQLKDTADFDEMYSRYWYHSGTNMTMRLALKDIVDSIEYVSSIKDGDTWLDIGCNDGTLLDHVNDSIVAVGMDPATNNCEAAKTIANVVINDYFSKKSYLEHHSSKAKVITSIAMFYDLPDPVDFCRDIYDVMDDDGVWVIQMSYLPLMLQQNAFDNICHEHLEYYSLESLELLLGMTGFKIYDCQLNDINGGSFRVYVKKDIGKEESFGTAPYRDVCRYRLESIRLKESELDLKNPSTYSDWFRGIELLKEQTVNFIKQEVSKGKTVWGYGASTKGNTLLQYFGLDKTLITGIAERQEQKWGLRTVGTDIPIYSEEYVRSMNPDYLFVLPWHFIHEFKQREQEFLSNGGKFIVSCPQFSVIGA